MKKEQTKNQQEKNQKKSQKLQWHPAFCSALRLELLEDAENLEFTDEFQLTEKPLHSKELTGARTSSGVCGLIRSNAKNLTRS